MKKNSVSSSHSQSNIEFLCSKPADIKYIKIYQESIKWSLFRIYDQHIVGIDQSQNDFCSID